jgi:hypothetical protein
VVDAFAVVLMEAFFGGVDKVESKFDDLALVEDFEAVAIVVSVFVKFATGEGFESGRGFGLGCLR